MFLIIALITLFHWLVVSWWYFYKRDVMVVNDLTTDFKEFVKCKYPRSKNLRYKDNYIYHYLINLYI